MKKRYLIFFLLVLSLLFANNSFAANTVVLKSLIQSPAKGRFGMTFSAYLDEVEKRSNGRIKFERHFSGSNLAERAKVLEATGAGTADLSLLHFRPEKIPLNCVGNTPGAYKHVWVAAKAFTKLHKTMPEMSEEMAKYNVKFVTTFGTGPFYLLNNNNIQSIKDLKGTTIRADGTMGALIKELGATPVETPMPFVKKALNDGKIDGVVFGPSAIAVFGMQEAAKYYWKANLGGGVGPIVINLDRWNSLPADLQKIIMEVGEDHPRAIEQIYQIDGDNISLAKIKKAGVKVTEASIQAQSVIDWVSQEIVWKRWANDLDAKGLPGSQVLERYLTYIEEFQPLCPFNNSRVMSKLDR